MSRDAKGSQQSAILALDHHHHQYHNNTALLQIPQQSISELLSVPNSSPYAQMKWPPSPSPVPGSTKRCSSYVGFRPLNSGNSDRGDIETLRDRILKDLGPVPEYSLESILDHCFPQTPANFVLPTMKQLVDAKIITNGHWTHFPRDASQAQLTENKYFLDLPTLCEEICSLSCFRGVMVMWGRVHGR